MDAYDFTQKQIVECDQRLQALLADLPAREVAAASGAAEDGTQPHGKKKRSTRNNKNLPRFDLKAELKRICGVDLTGIDDVDVLTAQGPKTQPGAAPESSAR